MWTDCSLCITGLSAEYSRTAAQRKRALRSSRGSVDFTLTLHLMPDSKTNATPLPFDELLVWLFRGRTHRGYGSRKSVWPDGTRPELRHRAPACELDDPAGSPKHEGPVGD